MSTKITLISNGERIIGIRKAVATKAYKIAPASLSYDQQHLLEHWLGYECFGELPTLTLQQKAQVARIFERSLVPDTARLPKGAMPGLAEYVAVLKEVSRVNRNHRSANATMAKMARRKPELALA